MEGARGVRGGTDPTLETAGVAGAGARRVQILKARPPIMKHFADPGPGLPTGVGGGARATGVVLFSHFSESLYIVLSCRSMSRERSRSRSRDRRRRSRS